MIDPWLPRAAGRRPDVVALETPESRLTYAALLAQAERVDVEAGSLVPLSMPPGVEFVVALHGSLLKGAVAVPIDSRLTSAERSALAVGGRTGHLAPKLRPSAEIRPAHPWLRGRDAGAPTPPDGLAVVMHTSGTTGAPTPVELSFGNMLANALGSAVALGLDRRERWLAPLPLSHVAGLMVLMRSVIYATTAIIEPFDAARVARRLSEDITVVSLVPTMLSRVLDQGLEPGPRLRCVLLGGAPAPRPLLARARDAGYPVQQTYGITEACSQVTVAAPGDVDTVGHPLPGVGVELANDGEILVTGPTVAGGGTLRTGDLGRFDERGRLTIVGRKADTIVSGGENVAPAEVETVLLDHPAVADAGVFGRAHPEWGEAVTAHVVLRNGAELDPDELRVWCRERLAGFKVPKAIEVAAALPRTASGKLLRRELR